MSTREPEPQGPVRIVGPAPADAKPTPTPAPTPTPGVRPDHGGGLSFGRIVSGLVLVVLGSLWLADVVDLVDLRAAIVIPALLAAVGLALLLGSFQGSHPALFTIGVLLSVVTLFSALTPPEALRGGVGERTYTPRTSSELEPSYELALGDLTLDMSRLVLEQRREVSVSVGAGDLVVVVPAGVSLSVDASVGAGEIEVLGEATEGLSVERSFDTAEAGTGRAHLSLDLEVGAGRIEVRR